MSNFTRMTKHPETGEMRMADWLDDHFGRHRYGVRFPDGKIFDEAEIPQDGIRDCVPIVDIDDGTARSPSGSNQDRVAALQSELAQWQDVGRRLFEYCRWWGLMGAEIKATLAVVDLAKLLGKDMQAEAVENAAVESSAATVEMIADWMVESNWIRRMSPDKREQFLKELRGLAEK